MQSNCSSLLVGLSSERSFCNRRRILSVYFIFMEKTIEVLSRYVRVLPPLSVLTIIHSIFNGLFNGGTLWDGYGFLNCVRYSVTAEPVDIGT